MEVKLELMKNNIKLWNLKVLKLKEQQEATKNYLTNSINNLRITNENLQKMENFMADAHANPKFINQIIAQLRKEQELSTSSSSRGCVGGLIQPSLPFMIPNLEKLSANPNLSFVYKLFDMVNDPNTNSIMLWGKSGTSFFIKDTEGLHNHVQERFSHSIKTFYKALGEFGFQCVDKYLHEYVNENFQREKQHLLKNMKSKRILVAIKKNMQSGMEEELKRLRFFQNAFKMNILKLKEKEPSTKCDLLLVKRFLESAYKRIAQKEQEETRVGLSPVDCQPQEYEKTRLEQDQPKFAVSKGVQKSAGREGGRRPWLDPKKVGMDVDIGKLKQALYKINLQILNLEQGDVFIKDQLAVIERILPGTEKKQEEIESSMKKLFTSPNAICGRKRSRENENNQKLEGGKRAHGNASPNKAMNKNDQSGNQESLTTNFESKESNSVLFYLLDNDTYTDTEYDHEGFMKWFRLFEGELTQVETGG